MAVVSRNEPCPCGSGLKYKRCCLGRGRQPGSKGWLWPLVFVLVSAGLSVAVGLGYGWKSGLGTSAAALLFGGILYVVRSPPPPGGKRGGGSEINFGR